jgi:hypothetical protein
MEIAGGALVFAAGVIAASIRPARARRRVRA